MDKRNIAIILIFLGLFAFGIVTFLNGDKKHRESFIDSKPEVVLEESTLEPQPLAEEATSEVFDIMLTSNGDSKFEMIKTVREVTGLTVGESKDFVDNVPVVIMEGVSLDEGEEIRDAIEASGGSVRLR